jgi:EAL domain-containing protein (putative c-di-GMP-specific phosphodiesterase class I)
VVVFSDAGERAADAVRPHGERAHAAIVARVRQALSQDDFVLFAQPVYHLRSMEVHTHELLIRMREPNGHLRPPAQFLPVAERSGLIVEIDEWVIRQAAGLAARGHDVSVNVSAASVGTPGFVETVAEVLDEAGADPRRVIMELTETAVVRDERPAREFIDAMRALGCEFALDDFGTGYGGFTYIKHLAIDYLKIDREFVRDLDRDISSRHVVEVIVSLASRFGLRTVAEGVESRACPEVLADLGVDYAQGYRLMRPAPLDRAFAQAGG